MVDPDGCILNKSKPTIKNKNQMKGQTLKKTLKTRYYMLFKCLIFAWTIILGSGKLNSKTSFRVV